jgi:hypothetical protein
MKMLRYIIMSRIQELYTGCNELQQLLTTFAFKVQLILRLRSYTEIAHFPHVEEVNPYSQKQTVTDLYPKTQLVFGFI